MAVNATFAVLPTPESPPGVTGSSVGGWVLVVLRAVGQW
jgi:hypothetical protein